MIYSKLHRIGGEKGRVETFVVALFLIFILGSIASLLLRRSRWHDRAAYISSLLGTMLALILSLNALIGGAGGSFSLWEIAPGLVLQYRLDSLSSFFLLILSLVGMALSIYGLGYGKEYADKGKGTLMGAEWNLFFLSMLLVLLAADAFTFLFAWEAMSLISFLLVMTDHDREPVRKAGYLYVAMTHLGTLFLFLAFFLLYKELGDFSFLMWEKLGPTLDGGLRSILFLLLLIGFGTKGGLMPLHIWLPRAHPVAPSHVSALLSAVMLKMAAYGMVRFFFGVLGEVSPWWGALLLWIGGASAFIGILYGVVENELKRFLAYSSSENMGLIVMGIGASLLFRTNGNELFSSFALMAALFHGLNHALFKGVLFMGAGSVLCATHTQNSNRLGGLIHRMPHTAFLFLLGGVALAAFPPLNGFMSEWMLYQSLLQISFSAPSFWQGGLGILAAVLLGMAGALAAGGVVKHFGTAFLAVPRTEEAAKAEEAPLSMRLGMAFLTLFLILFGLFPGIATGLIGRVIQSIGFKTGAVFPLLLVVPETETEIFLSPLLFPFLIFLFIGGAWALLRWKLGATKVSEGETWNCGTPYTPSMGYTATSASHPLLLMFRPFFRLERRVEMRGEYAYFPKGIAHRIDAHTLFEQFLYKPLLQFVLFLSRQIRRIQNGNLQSYLLYMIVTLILLLLWAQRG